jgi:hypothetical protein
VNAGSVRLFHYSVLAKRCTLVEKLTKTVKGPMLFGASPLDCR